MASRGHKNRQKDQKQSDLRLSEAQIEEIKPIVKEVIAQISVSETFSGPYPHPKHLEVYEKYFPGFLEKAVSLAEKEQSDHTKAAKRIDWQDFWVKMASLLIAFVFICGTVGGGFYLLLHDKDISGYVLTIGGLASVIWAIWNNRAKNPKPN